MSNQNKHGMSKTPEYSAYANAKQRCTNSQSKVWKDYGGRGIQFRFTSFKQFYLEVGKKPKGMWLDRIDNEGHYESGNVRWITPLGSQNNRRVAKISLRKQRAARANAIKARTAKSFVVSCPKGHAYSGDNVRFYTAKNGSVHRVCKACDRIRQRI